MTSRAALVASYQQQLHQLGTHLGAVAGQQWSNLGQWNEADIATLAEQLADVAAASTDHAMSLAHGFIALAANLELAEIDFDSYEPDWSPAFQTMWKALGDGRDFADALAIGLNVIGSIGFDAVQGAARSATNQIDRQEPRITGWDREPDGSACDWCIEVAGQTYRSADSADFGHDHCGCSVVPA